MKNIAKLAWCLFLLAMIAAPSFGQSLEQFEGRLKKREPIAQIKDKFHQPSVGDSHYTPLPGQRNCYSVEAETDLREKYPELGTAVEFEARLKPLIEAYQADAANRGPDNVIIIPVVVHVIHNGEPMGSGANISQAQIQSQIDVLNEDFRRTGAGANNHPAGADTEIQFALALLDPDGNIMPQPGIHRVNGGRASWTYEDIESSLKPNTSWDPLRYCNIWTVQLGGSSSDLLGYAQFPSLSNLPGLQQNEGLASTDGVVVRWQAFGRTGNVTAPYNRGRTTTHEIGHWLGLRHIWGDGGCNVDDFCNDTPRAGQPNYQCVAVNSCNTPNGDMIENYMDYTPDACMNIFTNNQKSRMRTVLMNSPRRRELPNSNVLQGGTNPGAPVATFTANRTSICTGQTIQFSGQSPGNPTSWSWAFYDEAGNLLATFSGQVQDITFNSPGLYSVELTASNAAGSSTRLEENFVAVVSSSSFNELIENVEDLNTAFADWVLFNPDADRTFTIADISSYGMGSHSVLFDNYSVDDDPSGTIDALISPAINLSSMSNPYLYFEHAYAQYTSEYSDTLVLFYSLDCGETFTPFWFKGGTDLATAAPTTSYFTPNANQWGWNQISLGFLAGQARVHFAIANLSGWGNNLYLDEISFVDAQDYTSGLPTSNFRTARTQVCQGEIIQFQDISGGFPRQWLWQFPGGSPASSNLQYPFVQYNTPGNFGVSLSVANSFGNNAASQFNYIQVVPLPNISVSASQLPACGGQPVTLTASGAVSYQWFDQRNGVLIFEGPAITVTLFENWEFAVVGTNSQGCENSAVFQLAVNAPAKPVITQQGNQLVSSVAPAYQWYYNSNPIPAAQGGTSRTIQPLVSGAFIVETFNAGGCASLSDPFTFNVMTGTQDQQDISHAVTAFPNPTDGALQLRISHESQGAFSLQVLNLLGQPVKTERFQKHTERFDWPLSLEGLPAGIYTIMLHHEDYRAVVRVVKSSL